MADNQTKTESTKQQAYDAAKLACPWNAYAGCRWPDCACKKRRWETAHL